MIVDQSCISFHKSKQWHFVALTKADKQETERRKSKLKQSILGEENIANLSNMQKDWSN